MKEKTEQPLEIHQILTPQGGPLSTADEPLPYQVPECQGQLIFNSTSYSISFELSYSAEGHIRIQCADLPVTAANLALAQAYYPTSTAVDLLRLEARDGSSHSITSDSAYLTHWYVRTDDPEGIELALSAARIDIDYPVTPTPETVTARAEFWVQGLRASREISRASPLGTVTLSGDPDPTNYAHMTASIAVEHTVSGILLIQWGLQCEQMVLSLLDVFSLGDGRMRAWCVKRLIGNGHIQALSLVAGGSATEPQQGMFAPLNLEPVLELAVDRYTVDLRDRTGMPVAIQWSLMRHSFREVRFLAAMTALEHLVHVFNEGTSPCILPDKKNSERMSKAVRRTIRDTIKLLEDEGRLPTEQAQPAVGLLYKQVINLLRVPLRQSLARMLDEYGVPLDGLEAHLEQMIKVRNDIVHRGMYQEGTPEDRSLAFYEGIAHELVKRVFLALLEYRGRYNSWLRGEEWVEFTPTHAPRLPSLAKPDSPGKVK